MMYEGVDDFVEDIDKVLGRLEQLEGLKRTLKHFDEMFERFCPYKVGDRVEVSKEYDFDKAPGWSHCAHFLYVGSPGTVMSRDFRDGHFIFVVVMDGDERKDSPSHFHMWETKLRAHVEAGPEHIFY